LRLNFARVGGGNPFFYEAEMFSAKAAAFLLLLQNDPDVGDALP
jgi:hypothetical protein